MLLHNCQYQQKHYYNAGWPIVYKKSNIAFTVLHYIIVNNTDDVVYKDEENNEILEGCLIQKK